MDLQVFHGPPLGRGATGWKNIKAPVESTGRGRLHAVEISRLDGVSGPSEGVSRFLPGRVVMRLLQT